MFIPRSYRKRLKKGCLRRNSLNSYQITLSNGLCLKELLKKP
jgi:hypothetical protein